MATAPEAPYCPPTVRTILPAIGCLIAAVLAVGCNPPEAPKGKKDGKASVVLPSRAVRTAAIESRPMERVVAVTGSLAALDHATLSVKVVER